VGGENLFGSKRAENKKIHIVAADFTAYASCYTVTSESSQARQTNRAFALSLMFCLWGVSTSLVAKEQKR